MDNLNNANPNKRKRKRKPRSEINKKAKLDIDQNEKDKLEENTHNDVNPEDNSTDDIKDNQPEVYTEFTQLKGKVSNKLLKAIDSEFNFTTFTEIQSRSLPILLNGKDLIGSAKTGSGKTLAFLIPTIQFLIKKDFVNKTPGLGILIISPTRELTIQTYKVLTSLLKYLPEITHGLIMGQNNKYEEQKMLEQGVHILVATPGRLLDHLKDTQGFVYKTIKCLILDEADKILDNGFEHQLNEILTIIPKQRQTMLFSATMNVKTEDIIKVALKADYHRIIAGQFDSSATVSGLEQFYVKVPSVHRLSALVYLLHDHKKKKVIVFFNSCNSVGFHAALMKLCKIGDITCIHGNMPQTDRTRNYEYFCSVESGMLFCTDVAARGLDIPAINIVFQYEPPKDEKEYIHRVGRTARGTGAIGQAFIFLQPKEILFCHYLQKANVPIKQSYLEIEDLSGIQKKLNNLVEKNNFESMAIEAFQDYFKSYNVLTLKSCFEIMNLDKDQVAKSFCLTNPPQLEQGLSLKKYKRRKKLQRKYGNQI